MRTYYYPLIVNGDMSQASIVSTNLTPAADMTSMFSYAIQIITSGNAVGILSVQGSCDQGNDLTTNVITNWTTVLSQALNAPDNMIANIADVSYRWVRVVYTRTSGSGNLLVQLNGKGI